jgi:predicted aspartyl protease
MNFNYSNDYVPAAPIAEISLVTAAESRRTQTLIAFVDSGADGTIIPSSILSEIRAPVTDERLIRSQWGERRRVLLYLVDVQIGDILLPGIEVVGDQLSDEIILGRDVLNRLHLTLDGPAEQLAVQV